MNEKQVYENQETAIKLLNENVRLKRITKEVREEIIKDREKQYSDLEKKAFYCDKTNKLLEILDKGDKNE